MRTIILGKIAELVPTFNAFIDDDGNLNIGKYDDGITLTVDTGFVGGIALPKNILEIMNLNFWGYETFILTTGEDVEFPVYLGKVVVETLKFEYEIETSFIEADYLIGMDFLTDAGSVLSLIFKKGEIKLMK
ncbi:MAG: hypothetical protein IIA88_06575 [Bacteroidetes bacterium]|nr:hypothetical protein [Bacteroidota bacterium]